MAEHTKDYVGKEQTFGAPYGNKTTLQFKMETDASGIVEDSDAAAALGSGDTVILGVLPQGSLLLDCLSIVSDVFKSSTTLALGWKYVDGVDVAATPQDADYFHAALALDAQSRTRANNVAVAPVKLPKDAYLYLTHSAHTQDTAGRVDFIVDTIQDGPV